jgi:hypothetical protein
MSAPPNCKLIGRWRIVEADNDDGSIEIEFAYHTTATKLSSRRNRYFFNSPLVLYPEGDCEADIDPMPRARQH